MDNRLAGSEGLTALEALNNLCWWLRVNRVEPVPGTFRHDRLSRPGVVTDAQGRVVTNTLFIGEPFELHRMGVEVR